VVIAAASPVASSAGPVAGDDRRLPGEDPAEHLGRVLEVAGTAVVEVEGAEPAARHHHREGDGAADAVLGGLGGELRPATVGRRLVDAHDRLRAGRVEAGASVVVVLGLVDLRGHLRRVDHRRRSTVLVTQRQARHVALHRRGGDVDQLAEHVVHRACTRDELLQQGRQQRKRVVHGLPSLEPRSRGFRAL
jgi:hypothetical protein